MHLLLCIDECTLSSIGVGQVSVAIVVHKGVVYMGADGIALLLQVAVEMTNYANVTPTGFLRPCQ